MRVLYGWAVMNPNLKQINEYNGDDITDLKIYYDKDVEQYKVRHHCDRCKLDLGCFCYETAEDAVYACNECSWACHRHMLQEVWRDCEMWAEIDVICGTDIKSLVIDDYNEGVDRTEDIDRIIKSITEEQASKILDMGELDTDYYDDNYIGEMCRL